MLLPESVSQRQLLRVSALNRFLAALGLGQFAKKHPPGSLPLEEITANSAIVDPSDAVVAFDPHLTDRAKTQWQFGDWANLAKLDSEALSNHPNKAMLALLSAAAHLQLGDVKAAETLLTLAQAGCCSKQLIVKTLISGVYNTLARAFAINGQQGKASIHFGIAVSLSPMQLDEKLVTKAREIEEMTRLGIPVLTNLSSKPSTFHVDELLKRALVCAPHEPGLIIAAAEIAQRRGQHQEAISLWNKLAAVDGEQMPQPYYDRLDQAYANIDGFPLGSPDEERLRGDGDKYDILKKIHVLLEPSTYLEIGVQTGKSLALANCAAIGVDPMPQISMALNPSVRLVRATSDNFFDSHADQMIKAPLDLVFIDGMHFFEYAFRDFINSEKYSEEHTVVVIDDIFPVHPAQAERDRRTRAWTGDVWKLLFILKQFRPDLGLLLLDAFPTGLLCITGLNKNNRELEIRYQEILQSFNQVSSPPDEILRRKSSVSCASGHLERFIEVVRALRERV